MLAQNNATTDYVMQATLCAMSIKKSMPNASVAVITDDVVPGSFKQFFSHIIPIPWGDSAVNEDWKIHNRWKIIHASPFDEAVILDTDMLVLTDLSKQIDVMKKYDIFYTNSVLDYRGNVVTSDFYRKNYTKYDIPSLYTAFSYFRKSEFAFKFYEYLNLFTENWQELYKVNESLVQKHASMDTTVGLVTKMLDCETSITSKLIHHNNPTFVHMKPNIQGWNRLSERWTTKVGAYLNKDLELYIGNYKQKGLFHYVENEFVKQDIIKEYCNYHGVTYEV
jgi:hypothetical protein